MKLASDLSFAYEDLSNYLVPQGGGNSPVSGTKPKGLTLREDVLVLRDDILRWLVRCGALQGVGLLPGPDSSFADEGHELLDRYNSVVSPRATDDLFIPCGSCHGRMTVGVDAATVECYDCDIVESVADLIKRSTR